MSLQCFYSAAMKTFETGLLSLHVEDRTSLHDTYLLYFIFILGPNFIFLGPRMLPKVTTGLGILKMKQAFSVFAGNLDHPNEQWNSLCDWTDLAD